MNQEKMEEQDIIKNSEERECPKSEQEEIIELFENIKVQNATLKKLEQELFAQVEDKNKKNKY